MDAQRGDDSARRLRPIGLLAGLLRVAAAVALVPNTAELTTGTAWFIATRAINALTVLAAIAVVFRRSSPPCTR